MYPPRAPVNPGWLAGVVVVEKQPGRWQRGWGRAAPAPGGSGEPTSPRGVVVLGCPAPGQLPAPWTPVPAGTCGCTAPATLGAFCIERDFVEFSAETLGPRSPGWGFLRLSAPGWGSGRARRRHCQPAARLKARPLGVLFSRVCPSPLPAMGCVLNGGQGSGARPLCLHSGESTLPDACRQPGCLAQRGAAGAGPGWCRPLGLRLPVCPRASPRGGSQLRRGFITAGAPSRRRGEPRVRAGRWAEGP